MKGVFRRTAAGLLAPVDDDAREIMAAWSPDAEKLVEVSSPRNIRQHRLWWKVCSVIAENQNTYPTRQAVSDVTLIGIGRCDPILLPGGVIYPKPHSISFASMSQEKFKQVFDDGTRYMTTVLIPGFDRDALVNEVDLLLR